MRIIERYIIKEVIKSFLACLFIFVFLYIIIDIFSHLDEILKQRLNYSYLVSYYSYFLPLIFVQVSPFSLLLAVLYTLGKLNRDNEITAMRSLGLSIYQITKGLLFLGVIVALLTFWINDRFVPVAFFKIQNMKMNLEKEKTPQKENEVINNFSMYGLKNRLYFVNRFYPKEKILEGITILEHDKNQNITKKIVANRGVYENGAWVFYQSLTYNYDQNGQIKGEPTYFDQELMNIPETSEDFLRQRQNPEYMNIAQLKDYLFKLSRSGATGAIRKLKVDLYYRFTKPLTAPLLILLAIPFAFMLKKKASGISSLAVAMMVGFLYYTLDAVSIAMGYEGILMPVLAVSLSHVIIILLSFKLIRHLP